MNSIAVPEHIAQEKAIEDATEKAAQLPEPCGYKMLIGLPKIEEKYESGILKADAIVRQDEVATVVGFVLKMGPDCYKDTVKFPTGPYCKEGDFILIRAYAGTRFKVHGAEMRLVNDDTCEGVVQDPRGYSRV